MNMIMIHQVIREYLSKVFYLTDICTWTKVYVDTRCKKLLISSFLHKKEAQAILSYPHQYHTQNGLSILLTMSGINNFYIGPRICTQKKGCSECITAHSMVGCSNCHVVVCST